MSVLLIHPPRKIMKGNIWKKIDRALPPLGLAYIASYLEKKGIHVTIADLHAEGNILDNFSYYLKSINPRFVGITATTVEITGALQIAELIKRAAPDTKIIMGGVHPSIMPEEILLHPYVDFVVLGEGEETMYELVSGSKGLNDILGLAYKVNGVIKYNSMRPHIEDINELPMPAYHLLPMERYKPSLGNYKRLPAASIISSRGCPGRCTFCYTGISGKKVRMLSASKLIEEIRFLQKKYRIKEISFYDDTFTVFKENVKEFCERMITERIDITWSCMSRVDFVETRILNLMKKSGCHQIGYGIESANIEILNNIKKSLSLDKVIKAVRMTKDAGIDVRGMFMFGNPGETEKSLQDTIDFAMILKPDLAIFNITTPYPGTEMYAWAKDNGYLRNIPWDEYDLSSVVMNLPTISEDKIRQYYHLAYKKFYFRLGYMINRIFKMRSIIDFKNNVRSLFSIMAFGLEK